MANKNEIAEALTGFIKRKAGGNNSLVCTVDSYDSETKTCYCIPIDDVADVQQVRICPDAGTGLFIVPKVNSIVVVSFLSDSSAYISMFSEFTEMAIGGDSFDGLVKVGSLVTKLNNLENKLNSVITIIKTTWIPVPNDGGAALKTAFSGVTTLTQTAQGDIENTVIKHGDGTT